MVDDLRTSNKLSFTILFYLLFAFFFFLFLFLGIWQCQRLSWKQNLIVAVEQRVKNKPIMAPATAEHSKLTLENSEYTPVKAIGSYLNHKEILVNAVTDLGSGFWVLTPFLDKDGMIIFVNRGFIPMDKKEQSTREQGLITGITEINGLLRMSEKDGRFFLKNKPENNLWYNRNIEQMAKVHDFQLVAPYFIDLADSKLDSNFPKAGLTVISFPNNHLNYAVTWFILAAMVLSFAIFFTLKGRK